ncbi:hypothetical protein JTB14_011363 [Gonioctena quinquepunctata]|nr:hypothetical protein JTB14_011363 [Gonioctena quinquepunctata]
MDERSEPSQSCSVHNEESKVQKYHTGPEGEESGEIEQKQMVSNPPHIMVKCLAPVLTILTGVAHYPLLIPQPIGKK